MRIFATGYYNRTAAFLRPFQKADSLFFAGNTIIHSEADVEPASTLDEVYTRGQHGMSEQEFVGGRSLSIGDVIVLRTAGRGVVGTYTVNSVGFLPVELSDVVDGTQRGAREAEFIRYTELRLLLNLPPDFGTVD